MPVPATARPVLQAAVVALSLLAAACGADDGAGPAPTSSTTVAPDGSTPVGGSGEEATELTVVPLPATVRGARDAAWTADGEGILFSEGTGGAVAGWLPY